MAAALGAVATITSAAGGLTGSPCGAGAGVTVVVDFTHFGGDVERGCAPGTPTNGLTALQDAGFTTAGTTQFGDAFVCRISDLPSAADQDCVSTPPGNAFWALYFAQPTDTAWTFSALGALSFHPAAGSIEAWAFGAHALPSITPAAASAASTSTSTSVPRTTTTSVPRTTTTSPAPPPKVPRPGYWMLGADGHVYAFGAARNFGSAPGPAVAIATRRDGRGYWVTDAAGAVSNFGAAQQFGGRPPRRAGERITAISASPSGNGYWLFSNLGRVFAYGDAHTFGDMSAVHLNAQIIASAVTPTGHGYYMVGSDGGVFSFGDARFHGSTGGLRLNRPVVGIAPTPDNGGYWLVASDGGVFAFRAPFRGSMGGTRLNRPVNGLVAYADGYLMVASDGGIFDFSNVAFLGSLAATPPPAPVIGVAAFTA